MDPECFWTWEANTRKMVLDQDLVDAATFGDVEVVADWLQSLDRSEDINEVDARGRTVLSLCVKGFQNHFDDNGGASFGLEDEIAAVKMILAKGGANVNLADECGWTPLHHACNSHGAFGTSVIHLLLAAGANVNAKTLSSHEDDAGAADGVTSGSSRLSRRRLLLRLTGFGAPPKSTRITSILNSRAQGWNMSPPC